MELTREEARFLLSLLKGHVTYYNALANQENCSWTNREKFRKTKALALKLEDFSRVGEPSE